MCTTRFKEVYVNIAMKYQNIRKAKFLSRPNRFIAYIDIQGKEEVCHVKNTGRCKELLIPGVRVFVQRVEGKHRKTKYDLIGVCKGNKIINIDSQAPNKVFFEWLNQNDIFKDVHSIKPECNYRNSRFDFYVQSSSRKIFIEVKGVTLEQRGVALFPDAPTQRGVKHIRELCQSVQEGYDAYIAFIIQMKDVLYFAPNYKTHWEFGEALKEAKSYGVKIVALDCDVTIDAISARDFVEVRL